MFGVILKSNWSEEPVTVNKTSTQDNFQDSMPLDPDMVAATWPKASFTVQRDISVRSTKTRGAAMPVATAISRLAGGLNPSPAMRSTARSRSCRGARARDTLGELRELLDTVFLAAGLRRIPFSESVFPYDDLVFEWMAQGRLEFDAAALRDACRRENLLASAAPTTVCYGVKSFEHPIDSLSVRCTDVLDLTGEFDERFIRDETDWSASLYRRAATGTIGTRARDWVHP